MATTQETAREQTHKQMRQQTEKLSTEIRKNYKSTFKTVTETTDTSSKRYVLENKTDKLINYELRRKMRQIGVQVQDVGTYLCWQSYVDEPGKQLGVSKLMHIAKTPDVDNIPHPEKIEYPKSFTKPFAIPIEFIQTSEDQGHLDEGYRDGNEVDTDTHEGYIETIQADFPQTVTCDQAGYRLAQVDLDTTGVDAQLSVHDLTQAEGSQVATFRVHLDYINFKGQSPVNVKATLHWTPTIEADKIDNENEQNLKQFTARLEQEYRKEFVTAAKERVTLASKIASRKYEDLREEERIVVYRKLIHDLLTNGIDMPDARTKHVVSELVNSIFDVDKMLYFVAPDWWQPRIREIQSLGKVAAPIDQAAPAASTGPPTPHARIQLHVGVPEANRLLDQNVVGWGGINEFGRDNYYITDQSEPAKLGSSLGWMLQLDGDNLRNAFLNAPWVKAVIPIRPGKELTALNWLKHVEGMNGIGDNDMYAGDEPGLKGKNMVTALKMLAEQVEAKHAKGKTTQEWDDPGDPGNKVTATPIDRVYEHGFDPLPNGFRPEEVTDDFQTCHQWVEILPTDQVAAVEVEYDPKTGRQI